MMKNILLLLIVSIVFFTTGCSDKTSKLEEECENGVNLSCNELGDIYIKGSEHLGIKKDILKAISFYTKACDNNDYKACMKVGNIYNLGIDIEKNENLAIGFYKKSCDGKYAIGCSMLEQIYHDKRDEKKALFYSEAFNQNKKEFTYVQKNINDVDSEYQRKTLYSNNSILTKKATPACPTQERLESFIQVGAMVPAIRSHPDCQVLYRGTVIDKVLERNWSTAKVLYTDIHGRSQIMYVTIESIR